MRSKPAVVYVHLVPRGARTALSGLELIGRNRLSPPAGTARLATGLEKW